MLNKYSIYFSDGKSSHSKFVMRIVSHEFAEADNEISVGDSVSGFPE